MKKILFSTMMLFCFCFSMQAQTRVNIQKLLQKASGADFTVITNAQGEQTYSLFSTELGDALASGTGISISGTTITNAAPDLTVVLTSGTGINVSGTYPNFTITNTVTDTDDQTAIEVPITDSGGYFTGTEVETALQEIGAALVGVAAGSPDKQKFDIASGTSTVTLTDFTLPASDDQFIIYRDGVAMVATDDYTRSGNVVTFVSALVAGERVLVYKPY